MSTSMSSVLFSSTLPPPRAKRVCSPYGVKIRRWANPHGLPYEIFDVVLPSGLVLRGCEVRGAGENRRVRVTGYEFIDGESKAVFNEIVLRAVDALEAGK